MTMVYRRYGSDGHQEDGDVLRDGSSAHDGNAAIYFIDGESVELPDPSWLSDARFHRDGFDLVLVLPNGESLRIVAYFAESTGSTGPVLQAGVTELSPDMVDLFLESGSFDLAQIGTNQEAIIGSIASLQGDVVVVQQDGARVALESGAAIYAGDRIETGDQSALRIAFLDESVFSVGAGATPGN